MGEHVWRRSRAQVAVLAAVLVVMVAGSALVGVCVLLTTAAPQRALQLAMAAAPEPDVQVGVALGFPEEPDDPAVDSLVAATARDASEAVATASALLTEPFGDLPTAQTAWRSSVMRYLQADGGDVRLGYLAELDDPDARGTVVSGRWPAGPGEVALPVSAAGALGLDVGSTTALAADARGAGAGAGVGLTVVGTFTPRPGPAWEEDPLRGAGVAPDHRGHLAAFGPFVVPPGGITASGIPLRRVTLVVAPDLARADGADLTRAGALVDALGDELDGALHDRAQNVVVDRPFARTLGEAREQTRVTSSGVLAVALLGAALAATTITLAARLVAGRRASEAALLAARGTGRGRLVAQAALEAAGLAVLSVVPATLLALGLYRTLADGVGLGRGPAPDGAPTLLVGSVSAVTLLLAALLVLPWLRTAAPSSTREERGGVLARSGADLLLLALAVLAYLQLRAHRVATGTVVDPVLVAAPVVCLLAGSALLLRPLALVARRVDARAGSSRSLTLPLAAWAVARRRQAAAAAFLLVLATASAVFAAGSAATWTQSQRDQAAAAVGTDLSAPAPAGALGTGAAVHAVTGGRVSAVTTRPTVLGSRAAGGEPVRLVAVDTRDAGGMLRGRLPTGSWDDATSGLAPAGEVGGARLPGTRAEVAVVGDVADGAPVTAALSLVLQDEEGARAAVPVGTVALDGAVSTFTAAVPRGARVVAVDARLSAGSSDPDRQSSPRLLLDVTLRGASSEAGGSWSVAAPPREDFVVATLDAVTADDVPGGVRIRLEGSVAFPGLSWSDGALTALAFEPVAQVPVVVSAPLADQLGLGAGDEIQVSLGASSVEATVQRVTPYVPSQPRGLAVLADVDTLSRVALSLGDLAPLTDAWWVGGDLRDGAAQTLEARGTGPVTALAAVAHEAVDGPLRAAQRASAALLVVAAVLLALAGTALHATTALEARRLDVARLSGLGAPRRSVLASLLAEQGFLVVVPVLLGGVLGVLACWALGPLLAVSAEGLAPVPAAVPRWPWSTQAAALGLLLVGCAAVVVPLADRVVRRSTVARLRADARA
ncbi:FtsX-like permease family protein [Cellulomonas sp. NPDC055163]